ncbi:metallo-beta-lactamase superfamily protein [Mycobacterium kansasii 732]|nr:metallo-beta-lactamase superfamily protein [Mycobacterium kansasii 732]
MNFYAVTERKAVTLVDCGFDGHRRYLAAWLEQTGRRQSDIEAVILTHGHADHVGFAERLRRKGIPVYLHDADAAFAQSSRGRLPPQRLRRRMWRLAALGLLGEAAADGVFVQPLLKSVNRLVCGSPLDVPGRPVPLLVGAHSAGSVVFHLPDRAALLTGDALMTRDPMFCGHDRPIVFAEHTANNAATVSALRNLTPYADDALLPGHGEPWAFAGGVGRAAQQAKIAA